ncbi:hypothetical protein HK096_005450, partial [Nowakowskiella sp. JEL0078]
FSATRQPREYDVERAIYSRDFSGAYSGVSSISNSARTESKLISAHEADLIDLCTPRAVIKSSAWSICNFKSAQSESKDVTSEPKNNIKRVSRIAKILQEGVKSEPVKDRNEKERDMIEKFRGDLDSFAYFLPPKFSEFTQWAIPAGDKSKMEFENVVLRFNTLLDVAKGNWENVVKAEKLNIFILNREIINGMGNDPGFMDGETLNYIVQSILPHDFPKGLQMGIRFAEIFEDSPTRNFSELADLLLMLLYPTVFDSEKNLSTVIADPEILEKSKKNQDDKTNKESISRKAIQIKQTKVREYIEHNKKGGKIRHLESPIESDKKIKEREQFLSPDVKNRRSSFSPNNFTGKEKNEPQTRTDILENILSNPKFVMTLIKTCVRNSDTIEEEIVRLFSPVDTTTVRPASNSISNSTPLVTAISASNPSVEGSSKRNVAGMTIKQAPSFVAGVTPTNNQIAMGERSISVIANKVYLDALLATKKYEEYFTVSLELVVLFSPFDFSRILLKCVQFEGISSVKKHIESLSAESTSFMTQALSLSQQLSTSTQTIIGSLTSAVKAQRESYTVVVRVLSVLAQLLEAYLKATTATGAQLDKDAAVINSTVEKMMSVLIGVLTQMNATLFRTLDTVERIIIRRGEKSTFCRDVAQSVKDTIVESIRLFPRWATEKRLLPAGSTLAGGPVWTTAEELNSILDRLNKLISTGKSVENLNE